MRKTIARTVKDKIKEIQKRIEEINIVTDPDEYDEFQDSIRVLKLLEREKEYLERIVRREI
jgi:hypothetical protein